MTGSPVATGGGGPSGLARGSFNADTFPDFAVVNRGSNTVTILLGGSTYASAGTPTATGGVFSTSIAVGDFNNDGKDDVVTANQTSNNVSILLGNGTGGLAAAAGSPVLTGG